ncbi:hypothetical protein, partial [Streptomyces sp. SP2-10]|uniref:hypothetical protein n=1 Tax=Streptomyces sp. SP2-10 TaxID=2873385 RepID=UPI001CA7A5B8
MTSRHQGSWTHYMMELPAGQYESRNIVPSGKVAMTCTCGWRTDAPHSEIDRIKREHKSEHKD